MNDKMISRVVATARVALGGKVKGYPVPRGRGLGVGLKTTPRQTKQILRNPNERPGGSSGRNEGTKLNVEIVLKRGGEGVRGCRKIARYRDAWKLILKEAWALHGPYSQWRRRRRRL